ncbi:quercetin dioxygenase-like cupin family protein [Arthrobacter pigmenti]|uniref:Quercetin dioxygenase-like cupin family protein n=1 Tax=Arthrobacter pigmenti TaxID=271432 RepID=A0A846RL17_9MICC|nr:cupin domain-containing protein [Arthrobacter pigmenti]NJC23903.1 quercetin dioxygenase-like cupin family protein [Arthrobacter pigmenti]
METTQTIPAEALRIPGSATLRFEGSDYGSGISFFLVDAEPGKGPDLHRHPYSETWVVLEGQATFDVGRTTFTAVAGDTAVVPADVWHGFKNSGASRLKIICIHASPTMIQEWFNQ